MPYLRINTLAFSFLLAPYSAPVIGVHPPTRRRAKDLVTAAKAFKVEVPNGFLENFGPPDPTIQTDREKFLAELADAGSSKLVPDLIISVDNYLTRKGVRRPTESRRDAILDHFRYYVSPPPGRELLADVINAGWLAYHDPRLWSESEIGEEEKYRILKELLLKSCEVLEVYDLMKSNQYVD